MRQQQHYDDNFDENGVLRDGRVARVPMMLRDSGRAIDASQHRPGYRLGDGDTRDERQKAYDAYSFDVENAWRGDDARKKLTQRDPQGRLMSTLEEEEEDVTDARPPVRDARSLAQVMHDHQVRMAAIYDLHDQEQANAWRKP